MIHLAQCRTREGEQMKVVFSSRRLLLSDGRISWGPWGCQAQGSGPYRSAKPGGQRLRGQAWDNTALASAEVPDLQTGPGAGLWEGPGTERTCSSPGKEASLLAQPPPPAFRHRSWGPRGPTVPQLLTPPR